MNSMTFNRGKLLRLAKAGKLVLVGSYRFDDMMGVERSKGTNVPVALAPADWHDRKPGVCYIREDEFKGAAGRAWQESSGVITLYVHSNSNYDLRIVE